MSTITKLNYLADTKDELKDKLNEHGANITDNDTFRSYVDKIKGIYNNWPKVTGEGTEITLTPTRKGRMQLDLKGNTEQAQYEGKNLLPYPYTESSKTTNGITFTDLGNGSIMINGTATGNAYFYLLGTSQFGHIQVPIPGNYIYCENSTNDINVRIFHFENNQYHILGQSTGQSSQINLDTYSTGFIELRVSSGVTVDNLVIKPMITMNEDNDYEPYTGGQPSPNPDYPQPIHVVTGNNTISIGNTDYSINLGSLELCKIGDYQDYLYKENGNWYIFKMIGETIFGNTEDLINYGGNGPLQIKNRINGYSTQNNIVPEGKCSISSLKARLNIYNKSEEGISYNNTDIFIFIINKNIEEIKSIITGASLYYILKTPTTTQITDENLISQLDAIENAMSTTGTTTISQTNADLPFIISASALKKGGN